MSAKMILTSFFFGCVLFVLASSDDAAPWPFSVYETAENIAAAGYPAETHQVTTSDGYILTMYRIPHGRSVEAVQGNRTVVFLMHGLLGASYHYIAIGAEYSIAYNLADAGFDVWMGNARGNKNSRYHTSLNPDDEQERMEFFDFTFEEIGMRDLPAMIDYALEYTGKEQLHYIGHSQGGTVFLVFASMLPEYNQKIRSAHLLAGVGYQQFFPNEELLQLAPLTDIIYSMALQRGIVELYPPNSTEMVPDDLFTLPSRAAASRAAASRAADFCTGDPQSRDMCELFGVRHLVRELSPTDLPGAALKQIAHYGQNIRDRQFRRYNHGLLGNLRIYGRIQPPAYNLSQITCHVTMHYALSDNLQDERDVLAMVEDMPNSISRQVARPTFEHGDFAGALDAKELVTDYIIDTIRNVELGAPTEETNEEQVIEATTQAQNQQDTGDSEVIIVDNIPEEINDNNADDNNDGNNQVPATDNPANIADDSVLDADGSINDIVASPVTDSATTLGAALHLIVLSLYVMLK